MSGPNKSNVWLFILIAKGILFDMHSRRSVLFFAVLACMLMVFSGSVLFAGWLWAVRLRFLIYWGTCMLLTLFCLLGAAYDLLCVRREARFERRRIQDEILRGGEPEEGRCSGDA